MLFKGAKIARLGSARLGSARQEHSAVFFSVSSLISYNL